MGREPAAQGLRAALEQHVRDLLGVDRHDARRVAADLLQSAGEAFGLARELHGRRVGEPLALPRHAGFDEPRQQMPMPPMIVRAKPSASTAAMPPPFLRPRLTRV